MDVKQDWDDLDAAIIAAEYDPEDCSFESSGLCLNGSRTITARCEGQYVASQFIRDRVECHG